MFDERWSASNSLDERPRVDDLGAAAEDRDPQFATTLARGLEILRCFTPEESLLGNSQFAARTGLSRPTISRFTYTLVRLGYLRADAASTKYMLGPAVLSLGYPMLASIALRQLARPAMAELATYAKGAVSLGLPDRLSVVYVETSRARPVLSQQLSDIGMTHPMIASAMGHAYIASRPVKAREALINTIRVTMPEAWNKHGAALAANIKLYHRTGFCRSQGEFRAGFFSVGVPLQVAPGRETYLFNCVMPAPALTPSRLESDIGPRLVAMVRKLQG
ncbi:MAG: iclR [Ramlibacter sp.]|nr:iclR [Ramlibacter sp.]